jgi:hypothetical protein
MRGLMRLILLLAFFSSIQTSFAQPSTSMQFIFRFYDGGKMLDKKALLKKFTSGMYDGQSKFWPYPAPTDHDDSIRSPFYYDDSSRYFIATISSVYPPYNFSLKNEHDSVLTILFPYIEKDFVCDSLTFHNGFFRIDTNCIDRKKIIHPGNYIRDMKRSLDAFYLLKNINWNFQHQQFIKDKYTWWSDLDETWKVN